MSNESQKIKHSKRIHNDETKTKKQVIIGKTFNANVSVPGKFTKRHAMNCGNPNCVMCGNPRKFFKELTMQEKKFKQTEDF